MMGSGCCGVNVPVPAPVQAQSMWKPILAHFCGEALENQPCSHAADGNEKRYNPSEGGFGSIKQNYIYASFLIQQSF